MWECSNFSSTELNSIFLYFCVCLNCKILAGLKVINKDQKIKIVAKCWQEYGTNRTLHSAGGNLD
jgi:hypothetical protein